jgi:hypothetical protein
MQPDGGKPKKHGWQWLLAGCCALSLCAISSVRGNDECGLHCHGTCTPDGVCTPNRTWFGYYPARWRKWPGTEQVGTGGELRPPVASTPGTGTTPGRPPIRPPVSVPGRPGEEPVLPPEMRTDLSQPFREVDEPRDATQPQPPRITPETEPEKTEPDSTDPPATTPQSDPPGDASEGSEGAALAPPANDTSSFGPRSTLNVAPRRGAMWAERAVVAEPVTPPEAGSTRPRRGLQWNVPARFVKPSDEGAPEGQVALATDAAPAEHAPLIVRRSAASTDHPLRKDEPIVGRRGWSESAGRLRSAGNPLRDRGTPGRNPLR